MKRFDVSVYREPHWWVIEIPALGVVGQARSRTEVPGVARELIALWLDVPVRRVVIPRIHYRSGSMI